MTFIILTFVIGYLIIIFASKLSLSRAALSLILAALLWSALSFQMDNLLPILTKKLAFVAELVLFLLGAMVIVELMDSHQSFDPLLQKIRVRSKPLLLLLVSLFSFFLSALLDNLTTMILMVSLLRRLLPNASDRFAPLCMVLIAANAGGAWTPIGDVTTTMLWIHGNLSTQKIVTMLFWPSLVAMLLPLAIFLTTFRGKFEIAKESKELAQVAASPKLFLFLGVAALLSVPLFHSVTGLPPFLGMLLAVAVLWVISDLLGKRKDHPEHLQLHSVLRRIDLSALLFFIGIILSIDAIDVIGALPAVGNFLFAGHEGSALGAIIIGLLTAIFGNVPMVAMTMEMMPLSILPMDHNFWLLLAYAAGTGGSLLLIGSAAGVALMSLEKIDFFPYAKRAAIPALLGFLGGISIFFTFFR